MKKEKFSIDKKRVLFVYVHNISRIQMAETFLNILLHQIRSKQ